MMLTAGIETTAATLAFAIAEIANQPPLRDAIVQELRGSQSGSADAEALPAQFPLTYRVIRETLRRHTIVPTMLREMEQDQRLSGTDPHTGASGSVTVRRGSVLRFLPMQGNMRASIWSEPRKFNPQRFAQPLQLEQRRNFHSFGIGPQSCPGRAMALTETILVLRAFFEHLDLEHRPISSGIAVERNLLLTVRPIGLAQRCAPRLGPARGQHGGPRPAGKSPICNHGPSRKGCRRSARQQHHHAVHTAKSPPDIANNYSQGVHRHAISTALRHCRRRSLTGPGRACKQCAGGRSARSSCQRGAGHARRHFGRPPRGSVRPTAAWIRA